MEVNSTTMTQVQQPKKRSKAVRQLANAAVTGGALCGTMVARDAMLKTLPGVSHEPLNGFKKSIGEFLANLGKKMFPNLEIKNSIIDATRKGKTSPYLDAMNSSGAKAARFLTGIVALGVLAVGTYKAGKIQGEGK